MSWRDVVYRFQEARRSSLQMVEASGESGNAGRGLNRGKRSQREEKRIYQY